MSKLATTGGGAEVRMSQNRGDRTSTHEDNMNPLKTEELSGTYYKDNHRLPNGNPGPQGLLEIKKGDVGETVNIINV